MSQAAVLGLGGTIDYELEWSASTLQSLAARLGVVDIDDPPLDVIDSEQALVRSILHHMRDGTGGEHFVESPEVILRFSEHFDYRTTLGGTAVRAAIAMHALGVPSTVHLVSINERMRRLLPPTVDYLCSADHDSTDPHLIVQYPSASEIHIGASNFVTPTANRLIYPSDRPNRDMVLSADLPAALRSARAFLVSGLNSIQEPEVLDARLEQLAAAMNELSDDAVVVYEDAAFHVPAFGARARDAIAKRANIYSLNEDELSAYSGRTVDLTNPADVRMAIESLHMEVPVPALVLHTGLFALVHGSHAHQFYDILSSGVAVSAARYANGDRVTRADIDRYATDRARNPAGRAVVDELQRDDANFCGVPTLDLRHIGRPTTIGLGDAFIGGMMATLIRR
jgi:ADP-dependent phosphofructokinase/glucokinase